MVCKVIENFVPIAFIAALIVFSSSSSSPIQNDILEDLKVELKNLRLKVDLLEARNVGNEAKIIKLEEKVDAKLQSDRLAPASFSDERVLLSTNQKEMNPTDIKESSRFDSHGKKGMIGSNNQQDSDNPLRTLNELSDSTDTNSRVHLIKGPRSSNTDYISSSPRAIAPSSCRDLSLIGHFLDGLYLVQSVDTNKIVTVLCNFGTSISQQLIGDVDVKTKNVHFYVTRNTSFSTANSIIPWELARVNEGGAMNLVSGIFTVPISGIYHFEFSGLKDISVPYVCIEMYVNGASFGAAGTSRTGQPITGTYDSYSLTASLRLKVGDQVSLSNTDNGVLFENGNHKNHFTGWLVEEDMSPIILR